MAQSDLLVAAAPTVLAFPALPMGQVCTVTVHTFHHLGNRAYENTAETVFEKTPLGPGPDGLVFRVVIRSFTQTNARGLNQLDEDMTKLKHELLVATDAAGRLVRILNKPQLKETFQKIQPDLLQRAASLPFITPNIINNIGLLLAGDGYLEDVLNSTPEYSLLFPGLYGRAYAATPAPLGQRLLPRIFGNVDLPLRTTANRVASVPAGVAYGVYATGRVDETEFRADDLQRALRAMTDQFDLDTTLQVHHQESYEFDANGEMLYGAQLSNYGVEGVFSTQVVSTLKAEPLT